MISWPTTTRHLHVLEDAGVVSVRREGRSAIYRLEREHVERVVGGWLAQLTPTTRPELGRSPNPRSATRGARS